MTEDRNRLYLFEILFRVVLAAVAYRLPLNILTADVHFYWLRADHLSLRHLPYRNFLWEYPPLTVLVLFFAPITGGNEHGFYVLFLVLTIACEYGSLCLIRRNRPERFTDITLTWSLSVLPLAMLAWYRMDFISILFASIALIAIHNKRVPVSAIVLGAFAKLWPILFSLEFIRRRQWLRLIVLVVTVSVVTAVWWVFSPSGFHTFLRFRDGSGFQIESLVGSLLLTFTNHPTDFVYGSVVLGVHQHQWLATLLNVLTVTAGIAGAAIVLKRPQVQVIPLLGGLLALILCLNRLLSPQFVLWLAPFVVLSVALRSRLAITFIVVTTLTFIEVLSYSALLDRNHLVEIVLLLRNIGLVYLAVMFLNKAFRSEEPV